MAKKAAVIALAVAVLCVWLLWLAQEWMLREVGMTWPIAERGQWGDTFGALNALLSALAFSAVLYTLWSQQQQITTAQKDQHKQRFDDTFFRLLSLLRAVRNEVHYPRPGGITVNGERALQVAAEEAKYLLMRRSTLRANREELGDLYSSKIHRKAEAALGPYFRLIYTVLRRIDDDSILSEADKSSYANLLRGQLGSPEVGLLALNGLTPDSEDLMKYLNRYGMLKYLTIEPILGAVKPYYEDDAFEDRN